MEIMGISKAKNFKNEDMKPLKVLIKDGVIDYQTVIEQVIGDWVSSLSCYDPNYDRKKQINGQEIERDRAYFVPDSDYEIIIRKINQ